MKKIKWIAVITIGMVVAACADQNPPTNTSGESGDNTNTPVTDTTGTATEVTNDSVVRIVYNGSEATISVPASIASYLTVRQSGAHVSITQSDDVAQEITYNLSGSSTDGEFYTSGATSPELGIDANTEGGYKLYVQGGTIVAVGGLESGASLTQSCYKASSWSKNTWYALTVGNDVFAFKTPSSGGSTMVVSGASTPTLKSGVTASGTSIFDGAGYYPASATGGSSVTLSSYSGNSGGPGGGGPGGGGRW